MEYVKYNKWKNLSLLELLLLVSRWPYTYEYEFFNEHRILRKVPYSFKEVLGIPKARRIKKKRDILLARMQKKMDDNWALAVEYPFKADRK